MGKQTNLSLGIGMLSDFINIVFWGSHKVHNVKMFVRIANVEEVEEMSNIAI